MKNIDTLIGDIYNLFTSDFSPSEEDVQEFGKRLATHVSNRIAEERGQATLRLSQIGKPDRQLWYEINHPELGEELRPEVRMKFLFGDILEELLLFLARQAGHEVSDEQEEVSIGDIKGHIDGIIDGVLIDCKSASSYSFKRFDSGLSRNNDSFGYISQLQSYLSAKDKEMGGFLVIDKTLGHITLDKHKRESKDWLSEISRKRKMLQGEIPPRCYSDIPEGKSGNRRLDVECSYCRFKNSCWPGLRTFLYARGPQYLTEVRREPDVPEVI